MSRSSGKSFKKSNGDYTAKKSTILWAEGPSWEFPSAKLAIEESMTAAEYGEFLIDDDACVFDFPEPAIRYHIEMASETQEELLSKVKTEPGLKGPEPLESLGKITDKPSMSSRTPSETVFRTRDDPQAHRPGAEPFKIADRTIGVTDPAFYFDRLDQLTYRLQDWKKSKMKFRNHVASARAHFKSLFSDSAFSCVERTFAYGSIAASWLHIQATYSPRTEIEGLEYLETAWSSISKAPSDSISKIVARIRDTADDFAAFKIRKSDIERSVCLSKALRADSANSSIWDLELRHSFNNQLDYGQMTAHLMLKDNELTAMRLLDKDKSREGKKKDSGNEKKKEGKKFDKGHSYDKDKAGAKSGYSHSNFTAPRPSASAAERQATPRRPAAQFSTSP